LSYDCNDSTCETSIDSVIIFFEQIQVLNAADELECWSLFSDSMSNIYQSETILKRSSHNFVKYVTDPRLNLLGSRLLLPRGINGTSVGLNILNLYT